MSERTITIPEGFHMDLPTAPEGMPNDEYMEHIEGFCAMLGVPRDFMTNMREGGMFVLDSISEETQEKVNWQKEGF